MTAPLWIAVALIVLGVSATATAFAVSRRGHDQLALAISYAGPVLCIAAFVVTRIHA